MCVGEEGLFETEAPDGMVDGGGRRFHVMGLRRDRVIHYRSR